MWVPAPAGQELIKMEPRKPIRIFHNGNEHDLGANGSCIPVGNESIPVKLPFKYQNFLEANNRTQLALEAKGYDARYAYGLKACHCQNEVFLEDFPNTLVWAWAKWKQKREEVAAAPHVWV